MKGSGLGLAIAREYALAHGGRVEVRERADGKQGAHFRCVPAVGAAEPARGVGRPRREANDAPGRWRGRASARPSHALRPRSSTRARRRASPVPLARCPSAAAPGERKRGARARAPPALGRRWSSPRRWSRSRPPRRAAAPAPCRRDRGAGGAGARVPNAGGAAYRRDRRPSRREDQQLSALLSDLQRYGAMSGDDVRRELNAVDAGARAPAQRLQPVRLAVLYTLAGPRRRTTSARCSCWKT